MLHRQRLKLWSLMVIFAGIVGAGCGTAGQVTGRHQPPAEVTNTGDQKGSHPTGSLVPIGPGKFRFSLSIPQGWKVQSTESQDLVTASPTGQRYPRVEITTKRLGVVQPVSEQEEIQQLTDLGIRNAKVRTVEWTGARVAHEVTFDDDRQPPKITVLGLWLYGSTFYTFVEFHATAADFLGWEPTFRASMKTFVPGNLDATALPGHP